MQNDNADIETETIQRLQLIEKFGDDANQGLLVAKQENTKILQDIQDQRSQHMEVMEEQNGQKKQMTLQLGKLEDNLKKLRLDLEAKQNTHQTAVLDKQEMLHYELNKM